MVQITGRSCSETNMKAANYLLNFTSISRCLSTVLFYKINKLLLNLMCQKKNYIQN